MAAGTLYVVATPIGNLEDVTLRALRVLREVDLIAAEDTRRTRTLLERHGIARPLTSYYDAIERRRAPALIERLRAGASVALVSDAGTPGIADPGYHLVRGALAAGVPVVPVPGPSALTALVSVAGFPAERFVFEGFLPSRPGPRAARLAALAREPRALVFFEAARRLIAFLAAAEAALGDRAAALARELTKRHEEILRGSLSELRERVARRASLRGEVTVLVTGAAEAEPAHGDEPAGGLPTRARARAGVRSGRGGRDDPRWRPGHELTRRCWAVPLHGEHRPPRVPSIPDDPEASDTREVLGIPRGQGCPVHDCRRRDQEIHGRDALSLPFLRREEPGVGGRKPFVWIDDLQLGAQTLHPFPFDRWVDVELGPGKQLAGHVYPDPEFFPLDPVQERCRGAGPPTPALAQEIHEEGGVDMHHGLGARAGLLRRERI